MTTEITHADATARAETLRTQLASIEADLAEARSRMDNHEVEAVLAATEIDTSFRTAVEKLSAKHSATLSLLRMVEHRVEVIRKKELEAEAAAKRADAERRIETLLKDHRAAAGAAIAAVLAANEQYLKLVATTKHIRAILVDELPDYRRRTPTIPPGAVNFLGENSIHEWQVDLCVFGYGEFVPDSSLAKRQFINKQNVQAAC